MYRNVRAVFLIVLLGLLGVGSAAAESRDPYVHFFNETFGNFAEELALARDEGKQGVMLFFEMDECPFCHYMKTNVLSQSEVQAYFREHFLMYPVDIEGDLEIADFSGVPMSQKEFATKIHRVRATPVFLFVDLDGNVVQRYTGRTRDVEEFMLLGQYVVDGVYRDMPFSRYKRQARR